MAQSQRKTAPSLPFHNVKLKSPHTTFRKRPTDLVFGPNIRRTGQYYKDELKVRPQLNKTQVRPSDRKTKEQMMKEKVTYRSQKYDGQQKSTYWSRTFLP